MMGSRRIGTAERKTKEVEIKIEICLDDPTDYEISLTTEEEEPGFG